MPPDAGSFAQEKQEHGRMQNFEATLLRQEGALVEAIEPATYRLGGEARAEPGEGGG